MAIVERPTKKGIVYWVVTRGHGERVGFDRREAERVNARRKKEVKAGTFAPEVSGAVTVGTYLQRWLDSRTNRGAVTDKSLIRNHGLTCAWLCAMRMDDVRPKHAKKFVLELQAKVSTKSGKSLKPKYIANINGAMKSAFSAALLDEVIQSDVWRLPPGMISKESEEADPYTREEAAALLASAELGRLVWLALAFYTGMRCGEVCGRRWRDYDPAPTPLGALTIATQYQDQKLKTDNPRVCPVHPELARVLADWWDFGFEAVYLRKPRPDDFIVPSRQSMDVSLKRSATYKAIAKDCAAAHVTCRGQHATRHTLISAIQRGGADPKVVEQITHNAAGTMIDRYTHREWDELCAAMLCLRPYGQKLVAALDSEISEGKKPMNFAPTQGLELRVSHKNPGNSGNLPERREVDRQSKVAGYRVPGAELDARQEFALPALALALAYCRVTSRRVAQGVA
jgi:integrase